MEDMNVTSEDYQEYFLLYAKMRHKAIDVHNDILKKVMGINSPFNPDRDIVEFVLDRLYEVDEDGEFETLDFPCPSVVVRKYNEKTKSHEIHSDFPITWLREDVDHVKVAREIKELGELGEERFNEYYLRFDERVKREEISLKLKGDLNPVLNQEFHTEKYIEISQIVDDEIKKMKKFEDLPEINFTDGLKAFIEDTKDPEEPENF